MEIIPSVRKHNSNYISVNFSIEINLDRKMIKEINSLFKETIFVFGNNGINFLKNKEKGYTIDFDKKVIKYCNYKDKVNSIFTIAQYICTYKKIPTFIRDYQKFEWIGLNIDIARTFFTKKELKKLIIIYSSLKYNKLHIHLTDDQGWRIEIKKYPELTKNEKALSQKDIKELVDYASLFGMDVIPEVGIPGHTCALLSKIDGLACGNKNVKKWEKFGVTEDVLCISNLKSKKVILDIYKEVSSIFPNKLLHIGGDECPVVSWENCINCQKKMLENNTNVHSLEDDFIEGIITNLKNELGRTPIIWDDIQENKEYKNLIVAFWRPWMLDKNLNYLNKILENNYLINSPNSYLYFDVSNNPKDNKEFGIDESWTTSLRKTFDFNPLKGIDKNYYHKVLGSEGSLWTERIHSFKRLIYQGFPRSFALSEILWGTKGNFDEFIEKIDNSKFVEIIAKDRYKGNYDNNIK